MSYPSPVPSSVITTASRLRVDVGQTGFFEGRDFRSFYELNVAAEATLNLRFVSPIDFILWEQALNLDSGSRRMAVYINATVSGAWTPIAPIGRNRMSTAPAYAPLAALSYGGNFTGGTLVEVIRVRTGSNQGNQRSSTVGARQSDERGLPAGSYIISLQPLGVETDAATGVYSIEWEERP